MQRSFGAGALIGSALLTLVLLGGCASASSVGGGAIDAINRGVPTRPAVERTSVVIEGTGTPRPLSKAMLRDLDQLAVDTGENVADVTRRQLGREQFASVMKTVASRDADILVSWGYENDEEYDAWVLFSEDPPPETLAKLGKAPLDVLVETGVTAQETELERVRQSLSDSLTATDGVIVSYTSIDVRDASITVSLIVSDSTVDIEAAELMALERATKVSVGDELPGPVVFTEVGETPEVTIPADLPDNSADGTVLVVGDYVRGGAAMQALVSGVIGVSDEGCITVGGNTVVAPRSSGFLDDGRIALAYLGEYAIGDTLAGTGGGYIEYGDGEGDSAFPAGYEQCGAGEWAVLEP